MRKKSYPLEQKREELLKKFPKINPEKLQKDDVLLLTNPLKGLPKTWCYEIMGNEDAQLLFYQFSRFITVNYTSEQWKLSLKEQKKNILKQREVIMRHDRSIYSECKEDLIEFAKAKHSRLAYQVLGVFLMNIGVFISDELKKLIINNTRWEDDVLYLKNKQEKKERKEVLIRFKEALKNYNNFLDEKLIKLNPEHGLLRSPIYHLKFKREKFNSMGKIQEEQILMNHNKQESLEVNYSQFLVDLKNLLEERIESDSHRKKGMLEYNGYKFIFKRWVEVPSVLHQSHSHKVCSLRSMRNFSCKNLAINDIVDLLKTIGQDIKIAGSLKTILPNMVFGGDEVLFDIWMFVRTPEGQMFPATLYYGVTRLSLGGWSNYFKEEDTQKNVFPNDFMELVNISPHNFNKEQKEEIVEALELALSRIRPSDFQGIFSFEGYSFWMGIKSGAPFINPL